MLCRIYGGLIEKEMDDHGVVQSGILKRHLGKCHRCQTYQQQLVRLENRLRSSEPDTVDPALFNRIRTGLQQQLADDVLGCAEAGGPVSRRMRWGPMAMRSVAALLVLAAIAGLWQHRNQRKLADSASRVLMNAQHICMQASLLFQSPEQPIQSEMTNLHADVARAVQFLRDCTPDNPYEMQNGLNSHEPAD